MSRFLVVFLIINIIFIIIFVFGSWYLINAFSFSFSTYQPTHFTRASWDIFTVSVQNFVYDNGALTPVSGVMIYPNIPAILLWTYLLVISPLLIELGRREAKAMYQKQKTTSK